VGQIKNYFKSWSATRIIRLVLGGMLFIAYYYNHESLFLFAGIVLTLQAAFNITCPGGSCGTNIRKKDKTIVKT
jgi:hypothetical protein